MFLQVGLWLGANVMLEYSLTQADDLLTKNFNQANLTMEQTDKDLDFLKFELIYIQLIYHNFV